MRAHTRWQRQVAGLRGTGGRARVSSGFCNSPSPKLASHWLNRERSTAGSDWASSVAGGGVAAVVLGSVSTDGSESGS
jgi:hypothetical protein